MKTNRNNHILAAEISGIFLYFRVSQKFFFKKRTGARCSSVVRAFAHGTMGRRIDP